MKQELEIYLIEEIRSMRERIASTVQEVSCLKLIGQSSSIEDGLIKIKALSPDIVLLDVDIPGAQDGKAIERVVNANSRAAVLCTSQFWNETSARIAVQSGAKGYLAKPFTPQELEQASKAAQLADSTNSNGGGKVITLFSPKGNCGKTTIAVNLALGIAEETGQSVCIADANLQSADVAMALNLSPVVSIADAARDRQYLSSTTLGSYLTGYSAAVKVLAGPKRPEQAELVTGEDISALLTMLRQSFRYIVVDTKQGFDEITMSAAEVADLVYVIGAIHSGREIDHVKRTLETFRKLDYQADKFKVIMNRVAKRDYDALAELENSIGYPVTALLPNDFPQAVGAINTGVPLIQNRINSPLAKAMRNITRDAAAGEVEVKTDDAPNRSLLTRVLGRR